MHWLLDGWFWHMQLKSLHNIYISFRYTDYIPFVYWRCKHWNIALNCRFARPGKLSKTKHHKLTVTWIIRIACAFNVFPFSLVGFIRDPFGTWVTASSELWILQIQINKNMHKKILFYWFLAWVRSDTIYLRAVSSHVLSGLTRFGPGVASAAELESCLFD